MRTNNDHRWSRIRAPSLKRAIVVTEGHLKGWYRNRNAVFWTLFFPIVMILLFGGAFDLFSQIKPELYVKNEDLSERGSPTPLSELLIEALNATQLLELKPWKEGAVPPRLLIIPQGFQKDVASGGGYVVLKEREGEASSLAPLVSSILDRLNLQVSGAPRFIILHQDRLEGPSPRFIEFLMPGILGLTIMSTGIFGAINTNTKYRSNGVLKKLATTPLRKSEWILGMMFYQLLLALLSATIIVVMSLLAFSLTITLNLMALMVLLAGALAFPGVGMLIARFVEDEESAEAAGNAITFPMMFLSGTFFPIEVMPSFIQLLAKALPLTYLNDGLRASLVLGRAEAALADVLILLAFGGATLLLGSWLTSWRDE